MCNYHKSNRFPHIGKIHIDDDSKGRRNYSNCEMNNGESGRVEDVIVIMRTVLI